MLEIKQEDCTGCCACSNCCPQAVISMVAGNDGFLYPVVNDESCINCGLCEKVCPILNPRYDNAEKPKCYAAMAADEVRMKSSSGGVFTLLAEAVLSAGGAVCGAAYHKDMFVKHVIIEKVEELDKLRRSKYVQSDIGGCYREIKALLRADREVLFCGTPCQVAGLKNYLGKAYDKLLLVDIICHGVPSPKVYQKYLKELKIEGEITDVNFRDKEKGWSTSAYLKVSTDEGCRRIESAKDCYMQLFLKDISVRQSCSVCRFCQMPRQGDLTIGDFWQIEACKSAYNDKKGTSVILENNDKGKAALERIKKHFKLLKEVDLKYALAGNPVLTAPFKMHSNRKYFFDNLEKMTLEENFKKCQNEHYDVAILNFWWSMNYGAVLTAYALQQSLKEWGYKSCLVKYIHPWCRYAYEDSYTQNFAKRYLDVSKNFDNVSELLELNEMVDTFVVGSDQVFRTKYVREDGFYTYLPFADADKKKIACAASFGVDELEAKASDKALLKYYLSCFDAVSVRELSGVDVCRKELEGEAEQIIDPVFWFGSERWDELIKNVGRTDTGFGLSYVLDQSEEITQTRNMVQRLFNVERVVDMGNAQKHRNIKLSPEEWLYNIKNCSYLVTDSFHGVCFAIIFNKPFVCLANYQRGVSRFESLFSLLGLESRLLLSGKDVSANPNILAPIDYEQINKKLQVEIWRAQEWMKNALKQPKSSEKHENEVISTLIQQVNIQNFERQRLERRLNETGKMLIKAGILRSMKIRYWRYKILSAITFGKTRQKYKKRRKEYKQKMRSIRDMIIGNR